MSLKMISLRRKLFGGILKIRLRNITTSSVLLQQTYYDTLGISRNASQADIKNAYFELSKLYHPDRIAATDENLAKFREISTAYEILGNEQSRKLYDRGLLKESRKPFDDEDDITDPIIKFYQKRQDLSKTLSQGFQYQAGDNWTRQFYSQDTVKAEIRQKILQNVAQERFERQEHPFGDLFIFVILAISVILFSTNFEGTGPETLWRKLFKH